jgi:prevent-host-death family protein
VGTRRARPGVVLDGARSAGQEVPEPAATMVRSTTEAQNAFGQVLSDAAADNVIVITKRDAPEAVVMSFERYQALMATRAPSLEALTAEFDQLFAQMRSPETIAATTSWLKASQPQVSRSAARGAPRSAPRAAARER